MSLEEVKNEPPKKTMPSPKLVTADDLLICCACGTQYDNLSEHEKDECRICDDPRQFVPMTGQAFTTLAQLRRDGHRNVFKQDEVDPRIWEVWTEPKFGIGQRAILMQTSHGNVLWDLLSYLDQETVDKIHSLGGLSCILISHPHFYTTYADWSATFSCPVYLAKVDADIWANRTKPHSPPGVDLRLLSETHTEIVPGVTATICGGHFDGSLVCHWADAYAGGGVLCLADTIFTVVASQNPPSKLSPEKNSYSFLFSIPNFVPLHPDAILRIWRAVKPFDFATTIGNVGMSGTMIVREKGADGVKVKERVLQSAKIAVRRMGWGEHEILAETL